MCLLLARTINKCLLGKVSVYRSSSSKNQVHVFVFPWDYDLVFI